ncbi:unnamed protein product [Boreogadus saida]
MQTLSHLQVAEVDSHRCPQQQLSFMSHALFAHRSQESKAAGPELITLHHIVKVFYSHFLPWSTLLLLRLLLMEAFLAHI